MKTGIIVFGHGSSVESANEAVRIIATQAAEKGAWDLYETTFLECAPRLRDGVAALTSRGATDILILPYFLTLGIHLQRDLPKLVHDLEQEFGISIHVTPPLDGHPQLSQILVERAVHAASAASAPR